MSHFVIKWVASRLLKDNQLNKFGVEDPYYEETLVGYAHDGKPKYKRVVRKVQEEIREHDAKVLNKVRKQAYRYDMWFSALGMRFGLSSVVGLVPAVGSIVIMHWSLSLF